MTQISPLHARIIVPCLSVCFSDTEKNGKGNVAGDENRKKKGGLPGNCFVYDHFTFYNYEQDLRVSEKLAYLYFMNSFILSILV